MLTHFYCMQRIPKTIAEVLGIPKGGNLFLSKGESDDYTDATYCTLGDGRLRFNSAWNTFCTDNGLVNGKLVLIMFSKVDDRVFMSIDVVN